MMPSFIRGSIAHVSKCGRVDVITAADVGYRLIPSASVPESGFVALFLVSGHDQNGVLTDTWGYPVPEDRDVHILLTGISGISGSKAFGIINKIGWKSFVEAVLHKDKTALSGVKGIGEKMVENILSYFVGAKLNLLPVLSDNGVSTKINHRYLEDAKSIIAPFVSGSPTLGDIEKSLLGVLEDTKDPEKEYNNYIETHGMRYLLAPLLRKLSKSQEDGDAESCY